MQTGPGASVAGFVLAGGRSSRMGRDKALLEIDGEPLVVRACRLVSKVAGSAVIVGDPRRYAHLGFTVLADSVAGRGPLGGLLTALENTTAVWSLVLACDMPALSASILLELVTHAKTRTDAQCVAAVSPAGTEPLCAVYHQSCLPVVRQAITENRLRMRELLQQLNCLPVPASGPNVLENINTPAEWSAYKAPQDN